MAGTVFDVLYRRTDMPGEIFRAAVSIIDGYSTPESIATILAVKLWGNNSAESVARIVIIDKKARN